MRAHNPAQQAKQSLDYILTEFSLFVKELCPEASVEITKTMYEDEDANILVRPPVAWTAEACDTLEERLSERSVDILLQTGYHILVGVFEAASKD
jgi:hypothetical protein